MKTIHDQRRFRLRLEQIHRDLDQAARSRYPYHRLTVLDLGGLLDARLPVLRCDYCTLPIDDDRFTFCPRTPLDRDGALEVANLALACVACAAAKGNLDHVEFRELWRVMAGWPKPVIRDVIIRLRHGARHAPEFPAPGSLEWFTSSHRRTG